ncbi:MAG: hypothetical protein LAT82_01320 [Nanoarchaeota archaeon]|nr:hypothetical protein [Nanoarchaeota archaeon]
MNININHELDRIRGSFSKVKEDLMHISSQVHEAYEDMMKKHELLRSEVSFLSSQVKGFQHTILNQKNSNSDSSIHKPQIDFLKSTIKDLKSEVSEAQRIHNQLTTDINHLKKHKIESRELQGMHEKIHTTELEVFLLKERMLEKDIEIKQLREMSKKLFEIVEDLSSVEMHIVENKELTRKVHT